MISYPNPVFPITQTDSTRAKTLELHIQARVAEELKRLQEREEQTFRDLAAKLSADDERGPASPDAADSAANTDSNTIHALSRASVQRDVAALKQKLENRKKVVEIGVLDAGVEKAREDVVKCLRANDRRPLDCWKEVEAFRDEVKKLEEKWVEKIVR